MENGQCLSRVRFIKEVHFALAAAGIDPNGYSGHSFRRGTASSAAQAGFSDYKIQLLGR
ncbi:hypothetical protein OF83DRAFT_1073138 [Amylostereum chailletii]|nr:hypothetical protein OF83DRAFT_1073138 [Amylostereum chailletii]